MQTEQVASYVHFSAQAIACYFYYLGVCASARGDFVLQINLLNTGFRGFYKCFTVPLHLFTIKKLQANAQPIALGYCFTKSSSS